MNKVRVQRLISDTLLSGSSGSIRELRELASPILTDLVPYLSAGPARTLAVKPENHVGGPDLHSGYKLGRNQTCREGSGTLSQENLLPRTPPLLALCCQLSSLLSSAEALASRFDLGGELRSGEFGSPPYRTTADNYVCFCVAFLCLFLFLVSVSNFLRSVVSVSRFRDRKSVV